MPPENLRLTNDMHRALVGLAKADASCRVWGILPDALHELLAIPMGGMTDLMAMVQANLDPATIEAAARRGRSPAIVGSTAVIPLKGVITPTTSFMSMLFGLGGGLDMFQSQLAEAMGDDSVGAIVIDVDSPGGLIDQVPETAAMVREAAKEKSITAVSNTMMASAAYWIGSQANELIITPSGEAGSIGVYAEHRDMSKALESMGMTPTLVSAGKFKTEGNPYEPLSEDARASLQGTVDEFYGMFVKDVAAGRQATVSAVKSGYGEGRVLTAKRAVEAGLADRVGTLNETIMGIVKRSKTADAGRSLAYSAEDSGRLAALLAGIPHNKESAH